MQLRLLTEKRSTAHTRARTLPWPESTEEEKRKVWTSYVVAAYSYHFLNVRWFVVKKTAWRRPFKSCVPLAKKRVLSWHPCCQLQMYLAIFACSRSGCWGCRKL